MRWTVDLYYQGRLDSSEMFATREEALAYYESTLGACRYGLMGFSVSYPREVA